MFLAEFFVSTMNGFILEKIKCFALKSFFQWFFSLSFRVKERLWINKQRENLKKKKDMEMGNKNGERRLQTDEDGQVK